VQGAILVNESGLCVAADHPDLGDPALLGALSATGIGALRMGLAHLNMGREDLVLVEAGRRQLVICPVGEDLMLIALLRPPSSSGEARRWVGEAARELAGIAQEHMIR
jgi:predicted regulator of Ras-like GTPase activity (Roadblock/LC7/MglB family)